MMSLIRDVLSPESELLTQCTVQGGAYIQNDFYKDAYVGEHKQGSFRRTEMYASCITFFMHCAFPDDIFPAHRS